jgi:uncharacterized protein (DUF3820 family)
MKMPFGKFKGYELEDIEPEYLEWLVKKVYLREPLRTAVFEVMEGIDCMDERKMQDPKKVKGVYRDLAMKYHPDRGGTKEAMQAVNEFYERLR